MRRGDEHRRFFTKGKDALKSGDVTPGVHDTIVAISTAMSDAGIGIVRISGPDAVAVADRIVVNARREHDLRERKTATIRFGYVVNGEGGVLDQALVSVFLAPHSYTGEDTVEINVHGGHLVTEETLSLLLKSGKQKGVRGTVRVAQPGEFTRRAFFNGKMDLTQAEAVQDLISANSRFAMKNAAEQLSGRLKERLQSMREALLHETAFLEAALDDPDVYGEELSSHGEKLKAVIGDLRQKTKEMLSTYEEGALRKNGIRCAIIGPVNAGKSSLLNALSGREKAIVSALPGTTRDIIEVSVQMREVLLHFSDTAGLRKTADPVEHEGVLRAREEAKEADIVLLLLDMEKPGEEGVKETLRTLKEKPLIAVLTKADLYDEQKREAAQRVLKRMLEEEGLSRTPSEVISSVTGEGMDELKERILQRLRIDRIVPREDFYLTSARHKEALSEAEESLRLAEDAIAQKTPEDLYLSDLMDAYRAFSAILGEAVEEDLIDKIFRDFCMGK